jgi:hypothetical protein
VLRNQLEGVLSIPILSARNILSMDCRQHYVFCSTKLESNKVTEMQRKTRWPLALAVGTALLALPLFPATADAQYLDPGAGSIIVQAVIAVVIGIAATLKLYWRRISAFVAKRSKQDPNLEP